MPRPPVTPLGLGFFITYNMEFRGWHMTQAHVPAVVQAPLELMLSKLGSYRGNVYPTLVPLREDVRALRGCRAEKWLNR